MIAGRLQFDARVAAPALGLVEGPDGAATADVSAAADATDDTNATSDGAGLLHGWPAETWPPVVAGAALALVAARIARRRRRHRREVEAGPRLLPPMQGHLVAGHARHAQHAPQRRDRTERVGQR